MSDESIDQQVPPPGSEAVAAPTPSDNAASGANPGFRIGSQRPGSRRVKAVAQHVLSESGPRDKIPVPSIRGGLPAELEQEVSDALEGFSLNELVDPAGKVSKATEIENETRRTGRVLKIHHGDVFVDLGEQHEGALSVTQFLDLPTIGSTIDVIVVRHNTEDGLYQLRLPGAAMEAGDWSTVSEGSVLSVKITAANKGGLECSVGGLRGFIPAGQISTYRVETFDQFVGETWTVVATDVRPEAKRLVLSRRAIIEREKAEAKDKMMKELAVGQVREGTVRSLMDFGAFVDLGGADGLLHISQLAWTRVKHPSEILTVGQAVKVKVKSIDEATGKIGLSLRDLMADPWMGATLRYKQGDVVSGPVVRILDKVGAFVQLEPGIDGLVHISELAHQRAWRVDDYVKVGQEVEAKILSIDPDTKRISLSIKALMARPEPVKKEPEIPEEPDTPPAPLPPQPKKLKGGVKGKSGGAQFGLKW
jgi:small subunit ribosomal protein S1